MWSPLDQSQHFLCCLFKKDGIRFAFNGAVTQSESYRLYQLLQDMVVVILFRAESMLQRHQSGIWISLYLSNKLSLYEKFSKLHVHTLLLQIVSHARKNLLFVSIE